MRQQVRLEKWRVRDLPKVFKVVLKTRTILNQTQLQVRFGPQTISLLPLLEAASILNLAPTPTVPGDP